MGSEGAVRDDLSGERIDFLPQQAYWTTILATPNSQIPQTLQPVIEKGILSHVGEPNPLLTSRARKLALAGLRSYDPARSRLQTHLYGQLQGTKRIARQQSRVVEVCCSTGSFCVPPSRN